MSNFALGLKALRSYCEKQDPMGWHRAKLVLDMFKVPERPAFEWVRDFVAKHHVMPQLDTLTQKFPEIKSVTAPEPPGYYADHLEKRYFNQLIDTANLESQNILKANPDDYAKSLEVMKACQAAIALQKYRAKILDVGVDGPNMVMTEYHKALTQEPQITFGWPYMDTMSGGLQGGDVVSIVGRPAAGKTFLMLRVALHNWQAGKNVLLVSMEMSPLALVQRVAAMYAHTPLTQLKTGSYATHGPGGKSTYSKFVAGLKGIASEKSKLWIVDGNLAATAEDMYELAAQLGAEVVLVDGAYLMKHPNTRLDRYTRVAENAELIKLRTSDLMIPTFASWQFKRGDKKAKTSSADIGLEDIAYSDAIGQTASIALGMFQEDTVETLYERIVRIMKGRNGEIGQFSIYWDFLGMNFDEVIEAANAKAQLDFL